MLRSEAIRSVRGLNSALIETGVYGLFKRLIGRGREDRIEPSQFFEILNNWTLRSSSFTPEQRFILETFALSALLDPKFWANFSTSLFGKSSEDGPRGMTGGLFETYHNLTALIESIPKFLQIFAQHGGADSEDNDRLNPSDVSKRYLRVILPENSGEVSDPQRIAMLMEAVSNMYSVANALSAQADRSDLVVAAIDSGSDKSFDFLGAAKAIEQVKELILGIYDRVLAAKRTKSSRVADAVTEALPLLHNLKIACDNGVISTEEHEKLKRRLLAGIDDFSKVGAITPEMLDITPEQPRELMKAETKLIRGPSDF